MRRIIILAVLLLVSIASARVDTVYVNPGDVITQSHLDDLGWHGGLVVINAGPRTVRMDVNLILRDGNFLKMVGDIELDRDVSGPTLNTISIIGNGLSFEGGSVNNTSGTGSAIYIDGIMNSIMSVHIENAVTGIYSNVGSQLNVWGTIVENTEIGMHFRHETNTAVFYSLVRDSEYGILIHDNCVALIQGCPIIGCWVGIHAGRASNVEIVGSEINGSRWPFRGLDFDGSALISVKDCRIYGDSVGLYAQYTDSLQVIGTVFENIVIHGVWLNSSTANIRNNNFVRVRNGVWLERGESYIFNNLFWRVNAPVGTPLHELRVDLLSHNHSGLFEDTTWHISNVPVNPTYGDPMFVDERDYALRAGSPCRRTGIEGYDRGITNYSDNWWHLPQETDGLIETEESLKALSFEVYPNPFNSGVSFSSLPRGAFVYIYASNGSLVDITQKSKWQPKKNVPSGTYTFKVKLENGDVLTGRGNYIK